MINKEEKLSNKSIDDIKGTDNLGVYNLLSFRKNPLKFLEQITDKYGEFVKFKLGPENVILVHDPELIKDVFVTNHHKFIKSRGLQMAKIVLGEGLLTSEHELHTRQRKMIQPSFSAKKINYYSEIMTDFTLKYSNSLKNGDEKDISKEMMSLTLDIVCKALFDTDVEADTKKLQESLEILIAMFDEITNPLYYLLKNTPLPKYKRFYEAKDFVDEIILKMIKERRGNSQDRNDLLSTMLNAQDEDDKKGMSDNQIKDETLTLFMAGHETTANLLTWTLYLISQNSRVEANIIKEIEQVVGDRTPNYNDIHNFTYLRKVLTESMRIYPPAWIIGRINTEEHLLNEYHIPKGTIFLSSQYIMHRSSKYYKSPLKFIPERWNDDRKNDIPKYAYFPFGTGPRVCIGEQFAWAEGILILSILLKKWRFVLSKEQKIDVKPLITMRPKYGMKMIIKERD
ncbi:MAG: cytochrome P450 [Candidatus Sericytochromatia bacterium]